MVTRQTIELATMGWADSLILMVLALVVFGPRRLPQIGRQIGKLMYEFRKASNDFKYQMEEELRSAEEADRRKKEEERLRTLALAAPAQPVIDFQVSEARPGPPGATESPLALPASNESPYPTTYPEEAAYRSALAPVAEVPAEEPYLRIQPPSTGEPVPAARPWSLEEELVKISGAADGNGVAPTTQTETIAATEEQPPAAVEAGPVEETPSASEPARHG
jgi:sec-independent protein translocase protein TatB